MGHVPLTRRRIYQTSVSRLLQIGVRVVQVRAQEVVIVAAEVRAGLLVRNGLTGPGWYGPAMSRERANVTPCPNPVPPSAAIR